MREMQLNYMYFTTYALWMQVLVLPQWTQGLSCFNCNSKTDNGCKNDELKGGHKNNMFSEKCFGSNAVCIKQIVVVQNYYEEHYSRVDMKKYYKAMDAECGTGLSAGPGVTSAPGGSGTTTGSEAGHPGSTVAAGSGAGDSQGDGIGAAGTGNCPSFTRKFPASLGVVARNEQRWVYSCGNRSDWKDDEGVPLSMEHCHTHSDGILLHTVCMCTGDLCNGATVRGAVPFLVLSVALMHLQGVIG